MKKLNKIWLFLVVALLSISKFADAKTELTSSTEVKWTTFDKVLEEAKAGNKKFILVDLYTDWCGWCKKMDENVFNEASISTELNADFAAVKFNAETAEPVLFKGKTYTFTKDGQRGANQLALELGKVGNKLGYPTIVILDVEGKKLQAFPGYKDVQTMSVILNYFKSESYKKMDFQQFQSGQ
ncbi:MAG TPA: DUF255 domain-containing protein [Chitinophagales bacterium]|jgi:thioredoxin-related protein|nr:DUF255 domain-containing protein [Chitinophagales bacterium]